MNVSTKTKALIIGFLMVAFSIASLVFIGLSIFFENASNNLSLEFGELALTFMFIASLLVPLFSEYDP